MMTERTGIMDINISDKEYHQLMLIDIASQNGDSCAVIYRAKGSNADCISVTGRTLDIISMIDSFIESIVKNHKQLKRKEVIEELMARSIMHEFAELDDKEKDLSQGQP